MQLEPWVITALISALTCAVTITATSHNLGKDKDAKDSAVEHHLSEIDTKLAVLTAELKQLSSRVEKHNGVIERVYKLESDEATMWRRHDELKDEVDSIKAGGTD